MTGTAFHLLVLLIVIGSGTPHAAGKNNPSRNDGKPLYGNTDVPAEKPGEKVPFEMRTTRRFNGTVRASFDGGKT